MIGYGARAGGNNSTATVRIRIGPTSLTGQIAASMAFGGTTTASSFMIQGVVTIRAAGASGAAIGALNSVYGTTQVLAVNSTTVSVDTTSTNLLEFTVTSGNAINTYTLYNLLLERIQ